MLPIYVGITINHDRDPHDRSFLREKKQVQVVKVFQKVKAPAPPVNLTVGDCWKST